MENALVFDVGTARYALDISLVETICVLPILTPIPFAPNWLAGAGIVHGEILPFIDLSALLGQDSDSPRCAILAQFGDMRAALMVDNVVSSINISGMLLNMNAAPDSAAERYLSDGTILISAEVLRAAIDVNAIK